MFGTEGYLESSVSGTVSQINGRYIFSGIFTYDFSNYYTFISSNPSSKTFHSGNLSGNFSIETSISQALFTASPENGTVPLKVSLDGSSITGINNQTSTFSWKSSDGQTATGATASFNYTKSGAYDVVLTITDDKGVVTTQSKRIVAAPVPKLASASYSIINNTPEQALPILVNDVPVQQNFSSGNDVDWYEFYAKAGSKYTIEIPGNSLGALANPSLELFDNKNNPLSSDVKQSSKGSGIKVTVTAPYTGLFRLKVTNNPPFAKANDPAAYQYQLHVFLTDAPQQSLVKGVVTNTCNNLGISQAEVSALLGTGVSDSTLTYKTGEYGLLLNPNTYNLKSTVTNFSNADQSVNLQQEINSIADFQQTPNSGCQNYTPTTLDTTLLKQQAVAVYDEQTGMLIIRDLWSGDNVYYAELQNVGDLHFQLTHAIRIPGTLHSLPGDYGYTPMVANLPTVYVLGKVYKVQLKNQGDWLFTIEKVE